MERDSMRKSLLRKRASTGFSRNSLAAVSFEDRLALIPEDSTPSSKLRQLYEMCLKVTASTLESRNRASEEEDEDEKETHSKKELIDKLFDARLNDDIVPGFDDILPSLSGTTACQEGIDKISKHVDKCELEMDLWEKEINSREQLLKKSLEESEVAKIKLSDRSLKKFKKELKKLKHQHQTLSFEELKILRGLSKSVESIEFSSKQVFNGILCMSKQL